MTFPQELTFSLGVPVCVKDEPRRHTGKGLRQVWLLKDKNTEGNTPVPEERE